LLGFVAVVVELDDGREAVELASLFPLESELEEEYRKWMEAGRRWLT
jgi:hypothetical protein